MTGAARALGSLLNKEGNRFPGFTFVFVDSFAPAHLACGGLWPSDPSARALRCPLSSVETRPGSGWGEVQLLLEGIDAGHDHFQFVAGLVDLLFLAADETLARLVESVKVVTQGGDVDQAAGHDVG